jgi:flagellar hook-length control protein FliK
MTASSMTVAAATPSSRPPPGPGAPANGDKGGDDFASELGRARAPAKPPAANAAAGTKKAADTKAPSKADNVTQPAEGARAEAASERQAAPEEATKAAQPSADPAPGAPGIAPATVPADMSMRLEAPTEPADTTPEAPEPRIAGVAGRDTALAATLRAQRPATDTPTTGVAGPTTTRGAQASAPLLAAERGEAVAAPVKPVTDGTASTPLPLPALPTLAAAAHSPSAAAAPPFEARLAAALDSAAFAPALASQVTWLVQEGVQQARLNLNPAEMGPVAVRIVLDGTQARIDFSADMAATRSALEASLPTLAAALHDSGLTLAGGGVFDGQARDGAAGARDPRQAFAAAGHGQAAGAAGADMATAAPVRAARGLVDLVA